MKIKINRNILWTETFVNELVLAGIKYACISPGSRNTPLTLAFANNKKIKSYVLVDEPRYHRSLSAKSSFDCMHC